MKMSVATTGAKNAKGLKSYSVYSIPCSHFSLREEECPDSGWIRAHPDALSRASEATTEHPVPAPGAPAIRWP